jgi:ABC-type sugar transport system ATPase subunit
LSEPILEIRNLTKHFAGVKALDAVSFDIQRGACHCIVGENGAGKSTLIKLLTGAYSKTSGSVTYNGQPFNPANTREAMQAGIGCLFQELNVVEQLRVEENISLGIEETRFGVLKKIDRKSKVFEILNRLDSNIDPRSFIEDLSVAQQQVVEIAKSLAMSSKLIIMDEPTAALSSEETNHLFEIIDELKKQGVTVIYISHRLDEIFQIANYVTVLRDGRMVATLPREKITSRAEMIQMMIGKMIIEDYVPNNFDRSVITLSVRGMTNAKLHDISFDLYQGEILAFYGLVGSGKTEIARVLFGLDRAEGMIEVFGERQRISEPTGAIQKGIALVPEERRTQGLCTDLPLSANIPMMNYRTITSNNLVSLSKIEKLAQKYIEKLSIACRSEHQTTVFLSGGNQQKVVISKCLNSNAKVFLLDEPTRGVDVGAKQEIFAIVRELTAQGNSVIFFSSELHEVLSLSDRICLLYNGELKTILDNTEDIDQQKIMHIVTGGN